MYAANILQYAANIRRERTYPALSHPTPSLPPTPSFQGGEQGRVGKMYCSSHPTRASQPAGRIGQHATPPPPPSPSPNWAEVARGGSSRGECSSSDQSHAKPPAPVSSSNNSSAPPIYNNTYTSSAPLPLHGRREEVSLWFSPTAVGEVATQAHAYHSGKRRRERARRARRREERRREAPPAMP